MEYATDEQSARLSPFPQSEAGGIRPLDDAVRILKDAEFNLVCGADPVWRIIYHARLHLEDQIQTSLTAEFKD